MVYIFYALFKTCIDEIEVNLRQSGRHMHNKTKPLNTGQCFYLEIFRLPVFFFHLKSLRVALPLSSFSTDSLRFASLLENRFLRDFLLEKLFFAMTDRSTRINRCVQLTSARYARSRQQMLCQH